MEDKTKVQMVTFIIFGVVALFMLYLDNPYAAYAVGILAFLMLPSPISEKILDILSGFIPSIIKK